MHEPRPWGVCCVGAGAEPEGAVARARFFGDRAACTQVPRCSDPPERAGLAFAIRIVLSIEKSAAELPGVVGYSRVHFSRLRPRRATQSPREDRIAAFRCNAHSAAQAARAL